MERGQLLGTAVRGKGLKVDPQENSSKSLPADPTTLGGGPERWWMPRALPAAVSGEGADVVLLLSRSPYPAPFFCGGRRLCGQGQEKVGEGDCSMVGP